MVSSFCFLEQWNDDGGGWNFSGAEGQPFLKPLDTDGELSSHLIIIITLKEPKSRDRKCISERGFYHHLSLAFWRSPKSNTVGGTCICVCVIWGLCAILRCGRRRNGWVGRATPWERGMRTRERPAKFSSSCVSVCMCSNFLSLSSPRPQTQRVGDCILTPWIWLLLWRWCWWHGIISYVWRWKRKRRKRRALTLLLIFGFIHSDDNMPHSGKY